MQNISVKDDIIRLVSGDFIVSLKPGVLQGLAFSPVAVMRTAC